MQERYKIVECKFTDNGIVVTENTLEEYGIFDMDFSKTGSLKFRQNYKGFPKTMYYGIEKVNTYDTSYRPEDKNVMIFEKDFIVDKKLVIMQYANEKIKSMQNSYDTLKCLMEKNLKVTSFITEFLKNTDKDEKTI